MKWGEALSVAAAYGWWRAVGSNRAGAVLARALAAADETIRTAAGMLLLRGGPRALPLLRDNLERGIAVPLSLRLLGDLGGTESASLIEPFLRHANPAIAAAAADGWRASAEGRR